MILSFIKQRKYILVILICLQTYGDYPLSAQKHSSVHLATLRALGHTDSCLCAIKLKWSMDDSYAWKLANNYGYFIDRYTILKEGRLLPIPVKKSLTTTPIKPKPLKEWESICQTDNNAAIIAQGIYGESFEVSGGNSQLSKIVSQSNELNQRFTFTLLAADRSFAAACMGGLGWIDSTVRKGEKYLYKIYPNTPKEKVLCDTALVFIGADSVSRPPKPSDLYAVYGDKSVFLSWDARVLKEFYTSYVVERSDDGVHFHHLSELPFSSLNDDSEKDSGRAFYIDTISYNNQSYSYRIKGITPFGEYGPPSNIVTGAGELLMAYAPNIKDATIVNDSTALITWEFPEKGSSMLDHFELNRSPNNADNSFVTVISHIDDTQRQIRYAPLQSSNYFTVTAIDKNGNKKSSFSYLVQPVDSIPPSVPTGLTAKIDLLGKVTLKWKANREPDLLGYVVLRNNNPKEEPSIVNTKPLTANSYEEKISLNSLNGKIYYSILALDRRMNQSKPCRQVELVKPDKIPPATPVLTSYKLTENGKIRLSWINSSSDDVESHLLLRKAETDTVWTTVTTVTDPKTTSYEDMPSSISGEFIYYSLRAIDRSHNFSDLSPVLRIASPTQFSDAQLKNLRADIDRNARTITLSWKISGTGIDEYTIYKARNKESYVTWKTLTGNQQFVTDDEISIGNTYRYGIRPMLQGNKHGEWKEVSINY